MSSLAGALAKRYVLGLLIGLQMEKWGTPSAFPTRRNRPNHLFLSRQQKSPLGTIGAFKGHISGRNKGVAWIIYTGLVQQETRIIN